MFVQAISEIPTPAVVFDESVLREDLDVARRVATLAGCRLLFSVKACYTPEILLLVGAAVDGYSTSTLFETRLAAELRAPHHSIHLTAPVVRADDVSELAVLAHQITFNSLGQWMRFHAAIPGETSLGIRVNPGFSLGVDPRYDPCRPTSQFGVPVEELRAATGPLFERLSGLHFHNNCESSDLAELAETMNRVARELPQLLARVRWLNVGGGYLLHDAVRVESFVRAAEDLRQRFGVELHFEPGASLVGRAGTLLGTVVDIVESDGVPVAMLDTTVHHLADVLDFDYSPDIRESVPEAPYRYVVAGSSCLAGDRFGEYRFASPLTIGARLTIEDVGAYSLSKATMFNGINLPSVWLAGASGARRIASYDYADFRRLAGFPR